MFERSGKTALGTLEQREEIKKEILWGVLYGRYISNKYNGIGIMSNKKQFMLGVSFMKMVFEINPKAYFMLDGEKVDKNNFERWLNKQ